MVIDYVRVYQNTIVDNQSPTNFTAAVGAITSSTVELLLNGIDNSGNVSYNVDYGTGNSATFSPSGVQKSFIISNLTPTTSYAFTVTATDASGNPAANNPIILNATTLTKLECSGTDTQSQEGPFTLGYKYAFETIGTSVKITFELLDIKLGLVAFLRKQSNLVETQMAPVSGQIFTQTITGQTIGSTLNYAVKFAYQNGLSVTKYFTYVVGSSCSLSIESASELQQYFYPNPVENKLNLQLLDDQNEIVLTDILGQKLQEETVNASHIIDMSAFRSGIYFLKVKNVHGIQNVKIIKK
jgi:hypothetical protein